MWCKGVCWPLRIREYLNQATAYIEDPEKTLEVRRELQAHLDEAIAEGTGHGLDPTSAELAAVDRMGSAHALAVQLAAAHHTHWPWRIYLSPVAVLGLVLLPEKWKPWMHGLLWGLLGYSLLPSLATMRRWIWLLYIDVAAKYCWIKLQPMRSALISGAPGGLAAGLSFSLIPVVSRLVYSHGWYERLVPPGFWSALAGLSWLVLLAPVLAGLLAVAVTRRFLSGDLVLTGASAALAFPLGSLPSLMWLWDSAGPFIWLLFNLLFALVALAVGWMARAASHAAVPGTRS